VNRDGVAFPRWNGPPRMLERHVRAHLDEARREAERESAKYSKRLRKRLQRVGVAVIDAHLTRGYPMKASDS
jgi:hypothetical protein